MAKFDVWIPNVEVEAENEKEALEKAAESLKELLEKKYVQNYGEAELKED